MKCNIDDVIIRELTINTDERGYLIELFRSDEIDQEYYPAMSYLSITKPGIIRGPHEHKEQADYFCFTGPSTFRIYLWDNRKDSDTFGEKFQIDAGEDNPLAIIIPKGVVHAYKNIGDIDGMVFNAPNRLYAGKNRIEDVDEIRYEITPDSKFKMED